jgi:hypothetical protein
MKHSPAAAPDYVMLQPHTGCDGVIKGGEDTFRTASSLYNSPSSLPTQLEASGKETTHYYELYGQVIFYLPLSQCLLYFFFSHITSNACATAQVKIMTIFLQDH